MRKIGYKLGWKAFNALTQAQVALYRRSDGRFGTKFFKGAPVCLVDHVGRKSGEHRTAPLIYVRDGDAVVIVASKGGSRRHPAWWINLREMDETTVQVKREHLRVRPREATDEERERLWPKLDEVWPSYADYRAKTDRKIPVIMLEPVA